jgi:hypothetical protein
LEGGGGLALTQAPASAQTQPLSSTDQSKEHSMVDTAENIAATQAAADSSPKPVIVRTYSAGAHFGFLKRRDGKEVELTGSRRIWRWYGAWTLSEVATGQLDTNKSKIGAPVDIVLTEAIEIIDCTPEAVAKFEAAKWAA